MVSELMLVGLALMGLGCGKSADVSMDGDSVDFGQTDEEGGYVFRDEDNDGYGDINYGGDDCDDENGRINPGAEEIPYNNVSDDCNPDTPDDDLDGDGWADVEDCNDLDPAFHPGAEEDCTTPIDYNCDGMLEFVDVDGDGSSDCVDCDDYRAERTPDADELCDNIDNDCDGIVDETPTNAQTFYADADFDGHGDSTASIYACDLPIGYVVSGAFDCDDSSHTTYPGAPELCNSLDDDCDAAVDESADGAWHTDNDGDGFGAGQSRDCGGAGNASDSGNDCDDTEPYVFPGAPELCDGLQNDCSDPSSYEDSVSFLADGRWRNDTPSWAVGNEDFPAQLTYDQPGEVKICSATSYVNLTIEADLTLGGAEWSHADLNGAQEGPVLTVETDNITVRLHNLNITNGSGLPVDLGSGLLTTGGGIFCDADATIEVEDIWLDENHTEQCSGIFIRDCDATLNDLSAYDNSATNGGGLCFIDSEVTLTDGYFNDNTAELRGGGLYILNSDVTLRDTSMTENIANLGGGLYIEDSTLTMTDTDFYSNISANGGGAAYITDSAVTYSDSYVSSNSALSYGGGIAALYSTLSLSDVQLYSNTTTSSTVGFGGALYLLESTSTIEDCLIYYNLANQGGGSYQDGGESTIIDSRWNTNTPSDYKSGGYSYTWDDNISVTCTSSGCF